MTQQMRSRWKSMQEELDALLKDLAAHDHALLNQRPAPEKWSVMQTVVHVMQSEKLTAAYLAKKLQHKRNFPKAGLGSRIRNILLQLSLRSSLKFKAPKAVSGSNLPEQARLVKVAEEWSGIRQEMEGLLRDIPPELLDKAIYRHPIVGLLSLPDMLKFLEGHFRRHRAQMYRTLEAVRAK